MLKVLINGSNGRMGKALIEQAPIENAEVACTKDIGDELETGLENCQAAIDFSFHTATVPLLKVLGDRNIPVVIGTTGHSDEELAQIKQAAMTLPIVLAGNYSIGVNVLFYLTQQAARILGERYSPEITEIHHKHKKDAPSGTALNLAQAIQSVEPFKDYLIQNGRSGDTGERPINEIGMHALRGGEVIGEHTVNFFGDNDRIELTHKASDRGIFASGAYRAAHWILDQKPGLYSMRDVLGLI